MYSRAKAISYGDIYVPVPGISGHKRRTKAIKAFVAIISVTAILTYLKLNLTNRIQANNQSTKKTFRHSNPCRHITPEPEIMLQEKFDSDDYFFPVSYKERVCAAPKKSVSQDQELKELQTCFTDSIKETEHHCVTRYQKFKVVRMPYPGNLTSEYWKMETIHVAVACECARTETVETYGT